MKSKKIYAILGGAMVICICVLAFKAGVQAAEKPTGYSEKYLKTHSILTANYMRTFPEAEIEDAFNMAEINCTFFSEEVESGMYLEWLK